MVAVPQTEREHAVTASVTGEAADPPSVISAVSWIFLTKTKVYLHKHICSVFKRVGASQMSDFTMWQERSVQINIVNMHK